MSFDIPLSCSSCCNSACLIAWDGFDGPAFKAYWSGITNCSIDSGRLKIESNSRIFGSFGTAAAYMYEFDVFLPSGGRGLYIANGFCLREGAIYGEDSRPMYVSCPELVANQWVRVQLFNDHVEALSGEAARTTIYIDDKMVCNLNNYAFGGIASYMAGALFGAVSTNYVGPIYVDNLRVISRKPLPSLDSNINKWCYKKPTLGLTDFNDRSLTHLSLTIGADSAFTSGLPGTYDLVRTDFGNNLFNAPASATFFDNGGVTHAITSVQIALGNAASITATNGEGLLGVFPSTSTFNLNLIDLDRYNPIADPTGAFAPALVFNVTKWATAQIPLQLRLQARKFPFTIDNKDNNFLTYVHP